MVERLEALLAAVAEDLTPPKGSSTPPPPNC